MHRRLVLVAVCTLFLLGGLVGCTAKPVVKEDETAADLLHIAGAYQTIISGGAPPPRELEQIKKVLADFHKANLNPPAEEVLTSSRDGQPYVVILGAQLGSVSSDDILIYEKKGLEGKRYVLLMSRDVRQLTDEEFAQAKFAMGHRPEKT